MPFQKYRISILKDKSDNLVAKKAFPNKDMEKNLDLSVATRIGNIQERYQHLEECNKNQQSLIKRLIAYSKEKEDQNNNLNKMITNLEKIVANLESDLNNLQKLNSVKDLLIANLELKDAKDTSLSDLEENSKFTQVNR